MWVKGGARTRALDRTTIVFFSPSGTQCDKPSQRSVLETYWSENCPVTLLGTSDVRVWGRSGHQIFPLLFSSYGVNSTFQNVSCSYSTKMWSMCPLLRKGQWCMVNVVIDEHGSLVTLGGPPRMSALVGHWDRGPGSQILRFRNSIQSPSDGCILVTGREADQRPCDSVLK